MSGVRVVAQQRSNRHDEARSAKAALQSVTFHEGLLHDAELALSACESFDSRDVAPVGLDREKQARSNRFVLEKDRATTACAVLASEMRTGETAVVAEEVAQRLARLDGR